MNSILILTENPTKLERGERDSILVATKSPYLFREQISENIQIIPLENEKVMPYQETYDILDEINGYIKRIVGQSRSWVYEAGYLIEGNRLAQKCSDALSAMEVLVNIFTKYTIGKVYLYPSVENLIECMLVRKIAQKNKFKVVVRYSGIRNFLITKNTGIVYSLKRIRYIMNAICRYIGLLQKAGKKQEREEKEYQIGLMISFYSLKHINWLLPLASGIREKFVSYKVICLRGQKTAKHFKDDGYASDSMEDWLTGETIKEKKREYIGLLFKIYKSVKNHLKIVYEEYDITSVILYFISLHLLVDVPGNLEIDAICQDYFSKNKFCAVSTYGDSCFAETRAEYFNTRKDQTKLFRIEGLKLFHLPRYEAYADIIDIRFMSPGAVRYQELMKQGWKGHAYFISDALYWSKFLDMQKTGFRELMKKENEELIVLWAPSYVLGGYTTFNTFEFNNRTILKKFEESNWKLYVKFHPVQSDDQVKTYTRQYSQSKNISFIDKNDSIFKWIEKVDVVITDKSLLIFDSIALGKPVIAICSPYHYFLIGQHQKGIQIYQNMDEMFKMLKEIEDDRTCFVRWREEVLRKQSAYFMSLMKESDPISDIADVLKQECSI